MNDFDGRQKAREALNHHRLYESIYENALDPIVLFDSSALILDANPAACALFGYSREKLRELTVWNLTPVENRGRIPELMNSLISAGTLSGDFTVLTWSGDRREIEFRSVANILPDVHQSALRDVTEQRQAEASLRLYSSHMKFLSRRVVELQEEERRHVASELHDEIGQVLSAASISLAAAQLAGDAETRSHLAKGIHLINGAIQDMRSLSLDLWPSMLDDLGLVSTLRWYADRQAQRAGFVLHFSVEPSGDRPRPDVATTCYRIVQEALSNVVRHARASEVWLEFHSNHDELKLLIRDNGVGFETVAVLDQSAKSMGFGILAMRERTENLNGKFEIESEPTRGTVIRVWIPVNR